MNINERFPGTGSGERGEASSEEALQQALAEMKTLQEKAARGEPVDDQEVRNLHERIERAQREKREIRKTF